MKKIILLIIILLNFQSLLIAENEEKYVNVLLFDVTGSMVGRGDGQGLDIFDNVKEITYSIIRGYTNDTYLVIIPFGRRVQENNIFEIHIRSNREKERAINFIRGLNATEPETWLTYSLGFAINKLRELEQKIPDFSNRKQQILLLTDGKGNGEGDLDANGNFTLDNFITNYQLGKTDFPYLFTRFFAFGDVLNQEQIKQLTDAGIETDKTIRQDVGKTQNILIKPHKVIIYDNYPRFDITFEYDTPLANQINVSVNIESDLANQAGSGFIIVPQEFNLTELQSFEIASILNKQSLERWMRENQLEKINGIISLEAENVFFQPSNKIAFDFAFETINIKVFHDELKVKNQGDIKLILENPTSETFEISVDIINASNNIDHLNYSVQPDKLRVMGNQTFTISISPASNNVLKTHRREINETVNGNLTLSLNPLSDNINIDSEDIIISVLITPNKIGPYILPAIIILLVVGVFFLWYFFLRPDFGKGDVLIFKDSVSESSFDLIQYRKRGLLNNSTSVGLGKNIDIDLEDNSLSLFPKKYGVIAKVKSGYFEYETPDGKQTIGEGEKKDLSEINFIIHCGNKQLEYKQEY